MHHDLESISSQVCVLKNTVSNPSRSSAILTVDAFIVSGELVFRASISNLAKVLFVGVIGESPGVLRFSLLTVEPLDQVLFVEALDDSRDTELLPGSVGTSSCLVMSPLVKMLSLVMSTGDDTTSAAFRPLP